MSSQEPEFDLFAPPEDDHLQEQLAKGSFQWTNKTTKVLSVVLLFVATLAGGAWYGHHTATSSTSSTLAGFASLRGQLRSGGFGGATASSGTAIGGAAGASGFGGFSRGTPATVTSINGKTVTITLTQDPTTPLAKGDNITVRSLAGGFAGAAPGATNGSVSGQVPSSTPSKGSTTSKTTTSKSTTSGGTSRSGATAGGTSSGAPSGGRAFGGGAGGGGFFNNPAFTACLAKQGVTIAPGARPDRTDPKVAAALQSCFSTLGIQRPGGAPGGSGGLATPAPAPSN